MNEWVRDKAQFYRRTTSLLGGLMTKGDSFALAMQDWHEMMEAKQCNERSEMSERTVVFRHSFEARGERESQRFGFTIEMQRAGVAVPILVIKDNITGNHVSLNPHNARKVRDLINIFLREAR